MKDGARCILLGGSGAVGRAVCERLSLGGARVGFTYLRGKEAAQALCKKHPESVARQVDVREIRALEQTLDELSAELCGVDALIHAVGIGETRPGSERLGFETLGEIDLAAWEEILAVNVRSAFFAVRKLLPALTAARGNIVLIGSIDVIKAVSAPPHYAASKGALRGLMTALSKELGPARIKVNLVAPGPLDGGIGRAIPGLLKQEFLKHSGLRRLGRPAEVAAVVAHLALENTYLTGQVLAVDGVL